MSDPNAGGTIEVKGVATVTYPDDDTVEQTAEDTDESLER